ncbi:MAG: hypothetical protein [Wendovervirus sonii]|uniref:Tail fiber protein n=1 Tax=phage Lak_Megaphage_Sonny TaxID=3109229 RepID=A0ABZ0Z3W4_9CAUD|nr:MAG: hypothetical protein [phage Lak_Megaphage_Sonny]
MQTAKSVQLTDGNNVNISPMTDLMSVYYEIETDKNIVARKYIYNDFPAGLTIYNASNISSFHVSANKADIINIANNEKLQYVKDGISNDIVISDVHNEKLKGTNYNVIVSNTYNLSDILFHYESKFAFNQSYNDISINTDNKISDIKNYVNTNIQDITTSINIQNISINQCNRIVVLEADKVDKLQKLHDNSEIFSYDNLLDIVNNELLISNKIYAMKYIPSLAGYNINNKIQSLRMVNDVNIDYYILYLKAININEFDKKVMCVSSVFNGISSDLLLEIEYDIHKNNITWMKDQYGNEAPYDFLHLTANGKYTFSDPDGNNLAYSKHITNNIIKHNSNINYMPVFIIQNSMQGNECDTVNTINLKCQDIINCNIKNSLFTIDVAINTRYPYIENVISENSVIDMSNSQNVFIINDKFINTTLHFDDNINIHDCNIMNSSINDNVLAMQQYTVKYADIYNSDIDIQDDLENVVIINDNSKNVLSSNIFKTYQNIYAGSFNQI